MLVYFVWLFKNGILNELELEMIGKEEKLKCFCKFYWFWGFEILLIFFMFSNMFVLEKKLVDFYICDFLLDFWILLVLYMGKIFKVWIIFIFFELYKEYFFLFFWMIGFEKLGVNKEFWRMLKVVFKVIFFRYGLWV